MVLQTIAEASSSGNARVKMPGPLGAALTAAAAGSALGATLLASCATTSAGAGGRVASGAAARAAALEGRDALAPGAPGDASAMSRRAVPSTPEGMAFRLAERFSDAEVPFTMAETSSATGSGVGSSTMYSVKVRVIVKVQPLAPALTDDVTTVPKSLPLAPRPLLTP